MSHETPAADLASLGVGSLVWMASAQPLLDERTEDQLIRRARNGSKDALEQLGMCNLRIVIDEARATCARGCARPSRRRSR